jgi:delta 1-pyrroline-5-carboxylate dehydrogenase
MTVLTPPTLMDARIWTGKIFNGEWITPTGGTYPVMEPATGEQLGVVGRASVEDVQQAAEQAAEAQRSWARTHFTSGPEFCAVQGNSGSNTRQRFGNG